MSASAAHAVFPVPCMQPDTRDSHTSTVVSTASPRFAKDFDASASLWSSTAFRASPPKLRKPGSFRQSSWSMRRGNSGLKLDVEESSYVVDDGAVVSSERLRSLSPDPQRPVVASGTSQPWYLGGKRSPLKAARSPDVQGLNSDGGIAAVFGIHFGQRAK
jgi:hypothetical protein